MNPSVNRQETTKEKFVRQLILASTHNNGVPTSDNVKEFLDLYELTVDTSSDADVLSGAWVPGSVYPGAKGLYYVYVKQLKAALPAKFCTTKLRWYDVFGEDDFAYPVTAWQLNPFSEPQFEITS